MKEIEDSLAIPTGSSENKNSGEQSSSSSAHSDSSGDASGHASPPPEPTSDSAASSDSTTLRIEGLAQRPTVKKGPAFSTTSRFIVDKELGRGGIGVTYLAIDTENNCSRVAIKVLLKRLGEEKAWIERHFQSEVEALSRIDHPGVIKLVSSGHTADGEPYLAMEFVEGWDLRSFIVPEKGLGEFGRVARIIRQIGDAISAAHDKGIYHRDLKPENIMIQSADDGETVKVIDFGLATVKESLDDKTKTTILAGSIRYMAPEQILGKPTRATDIYALGIIAYEMITGRTPFNPDLGHPLASLRQLLEMQQDGVRVMPKDLRPSLPLSAQQVILKALEYEKTNRYLRADEFGADLADALSEDNGESLVESYINRSSGSTRVRTQLSPNPKAPMSGRQHENVQSRRVKVVVGLVASFVAVALLLFAWSRLQSGQPTDSESSNPTAGRERTLSYWVLLQKYKGTRPDGAPVRLLGREMYFATGDELQFFITASDTGHLYLLSDGQSERKSGSYFLLFPTPRTNNSSSLIQATSEVATDKSFFDAKAGDEKVWIVWSASAIPEMEAVITKWKSEAFLGEITEPTTVSFIKNLVEENSKTPALVEQDDKNNRMNIRARGDILVRLVTLAHL